ncbi:Spc98 family-domain-containing protein [Naematelia encephala]|uniref:Spc98 family-domain-containing protein n=1 Tax=Naematelia encephala TaxID=71784 RepID=A0A1Y2BGY4_9TREE|nr:Spc98 family-domain-containing protein [Naematelia encephala]
MASITTNRVFVLPKLDASYPSLKSLSAVQPLFSIPLLDEHSSGSERLLSGLTRSTSLTYPASKGKEREVVLDEAGLDGAVDGKVESVDEKASAAQPDVWTILSQEDAGPSRSRHTFQPIRTWDVLESADESRNPFLSESSVFAFDSQITLTEPSLNLPKINQNGPVPPRDSKDLLHLMMRATMGTVSTESLKWEGKKGRYTFAESGGRILGIDRIASSSIIDNFLVIGTALRRLEMIVDTQSSIPLTPTHHALLHATMTYLALIRQRLTTAIDQCITSGRPDWVKWSLGLNEIRGLLEVLCDLLCWPLSETKPLPLPSRASSLLTHLYSFLLALLSTSSPAQQSDHTSLALAYLLQHSAKPLLDLLHQWVGLTATEDDADPESQPWADLGITRTKNKKSSDGEIKWEYTLSARRMPGFIPVESRRVLFEAGRSLRLLRDASASQHPLSSGSWGIVGTWDWGSNAAATVDLKGHVRRVHREVDYWRRSVRNRTRPMSGSTTFQRFTAPPKQRKGLPVEFTRRSSLPSPLQSQGQLEAKSATPQGDVDALWTLFGQVPGSHLESNRGNSLWSPTPLDELRAFIARHSDPSDPVLPFQTPTLPLYVSQILLAPLLTHADLVSTSLVSLYLDDLRLLDHLDVLRSFWLGGDVGFAERVSGALFGKEEAGAGEALGLGRRARTRARMGLGGIESGNGADEGEWGIGLGLGLSERARWPPGGAELAYALRTTLLEDSTLDVNDKGPVWEEIEDRVSFAVKNLPEDNVDGTRAKWMNPQSIDALDFLYLSYSPPASIAALLPSNLMVKYQNVHNFLLRLARVDTVLRTLYIDVTHQSDEFDEPLKIGVDLGSRPASRVSSRQRRCIFPPGEKVEAYLQTLRFRMTHFISALNRYVLDTAVGANWTLMRKRLERLKRRVPGKESSRPSTPAAETEQDEYFQFDVGEEAEDHEDEDQENEGPINVSQLKSIHSLVGYHHVVLDRILASCLLGDHAGHQVTFKVLMGLFGLVLDLGKVIKEIQRGIRGWEDGAERVRDIGKDWMEREAVFLHALERLSLRAIKAPLVEHAADELDLKVLLDGEREREIDDGNDDGGGDHARSGRDGQGINDLGELLLRIRLNGGAGRHGRHEEEV